MIITEHYIKIETVEKLRKINDWKFDKGYRMSRRPY